MSLTFCRVRFVFTCMLTFISGVPAWAFHYFCSYQLSVVNDWLQCMEKGKSVSSVFFDINKA